MPLGTAQLREAEERSTIAESEVRQEVAAEMRELLEQMECNYKVSAPVVCACLVQIASHAITGPV